MLQYCLYYSIRLFSLTHLDLDVVTEKFTVNCFFMNKDVYFYRFVCIFLHNVKLQVLSTFVDIFLEGLYGKLRIFINVITKHECSSYRNLKIEILIAHILY